MSFENELLMHAGKIIPPECLRLRIIDICQEGHLGISKTKSRMKLLYWWPGMDVQIERKLRDCSLCNNSEKNLASLKPPLCPPKCPNMPWEKLSLDILGPVQNGSVVKYVIVLMDHFAKWPEIKFVNNVDAVSVIDFLDKLFLREGLPCTILTDNGPQFCSNVFKEFLSRNGISQTFTSIYHPAGNGIVERFNRVLKNAIQLAKEAVLTGLKKCGKRCGRTESHNVLLVLVHLKS